MNTKANIDGKSQIVLLDSTKSQSSLRCLPLVPFIKIRLEQLKEEQERNRKKHGYSYNKAYIGYLCVNETGDIISPDNLTKSFKLFLKRNGLKEIRFHDLRHSCASMLLANGVPMKQIQEWLGHSDYSTTVSIRNRNTNTLNSQSYLILKINTVCSANEANIRYFTYD